MRQLTLILFLFAVSLVASAGETNYFCVVCGQGPLQGQIWRHPRGMVCDACHQLENTCSICGLPVLEGFTKTADGRLICKFDKADAVLNTADAKRIFTDTRREVLAMYGPGFALQFPNATVNVFDVDYWSEKGRTDGLHKFGFSLTRKQPDGQCTHTVVLLSGRLRAETSAAAAHEYTHLWINENRPAAHEIEADTLEAICELTAYKLMARRKNPELQKSVLESPYTNGKIKTLVEIEREHGIGYIWNWVKNGTTATLATSSARAASLQKPAMTATNVPPPLPKTLKFSGLLTIGPDSQAVINGVAFAAGDQKQIKLRDKAVTVRCREIQAGAVVLELNGSPDRILLKKGQEALPP